MVFFVLVEVIGQFELRRQNRLRFWNWFPNPCAPARKKHICKQMCFFQLYSPCGELYCFAVIFGLRRVIFASRVLEANRISLKPQGFNITIALSDNITPTKSEYNLTNHQFCCIILVEVILCQIAF